MVQQMDGYARQKSTTLARVSGVLESRGMRR
jgi:hypothetical protein